MTPNEHLIILYLFFEAARLRGSVRRWRQPLLRGPEWFFNVHVQPGFYTGAGKKILDRYRLRIFLPFAIDIPVAAAIFLSGRLPWLSALVIGLTAFIHIHHVNSVARAERQARPFAVAEDEQPVASMAFSLKPRRLRDYSDPGIEWALGLGSLAALVWLVRYYFAAPEHHNLRMVFGTPLFYLYTQLGILFAKRVIVAWRTPVPQAHAEEYLEAREQTRRYYLLFCDLNRAVLTAGLLFWPILLSLPPARINQLRSIWFAVWMVAVLVSAVWVEIQRKRLVEVSLRARPVKMPDFMGESELARWPMCYQPSVPMLVLKGARGYSLNLANTLIRMGAAYMAGMAGLIVLLALRR
jgi:hypothetical protein